MIIKRAFKICRLANTAGQFKSCYIQSETLSPDVDRVYSIDKWTRHSKKAGALTVFTTLQAAAEFYNYNTARHLGRKFLDWLIFQCEYIPTSRGIFYRYTQPERNAALRWYDKNQHLEDGESELRTQDKPGKFTAKAAAVLLLDYPIAPRYLTLLIRQHEDAAEMVHKRQRQLDEAHKVHQTKQAGLRSVYHAAGRI